MMNYPQQFDMSTGYAPHAQQYGQSVQPFQPVTQPAAQAEAPGVAEIKKFLRRLCEGYTHGTLAQPVPNQKKPGSFTKAEPKRSNIAKKIEQDYAKTAGQQLNWYFRTYYFPAINMAGSVSVLSEFLSTRLSKSKNYYDVDCSQIALASLLQVMSKNHSMYLAHENIGQSGSVYVLRHLGEFSAKRIIAENEARGDARLSDEALAKLIEQHKLHVLQSLYDQFIVGVFDVAVELVKAHCMAVVNQNGGVGSYGFDPNVRSRVRNYILTQMYDSITSDIESRVAPHLTPLLVEVPRTDYFNDALFEEKVKDSSNMITISELTVLMQKLNVVKNVTLGLPAWTRKELDNGGVMYGSLPLNPDSAHKLSYMFGMNWKGTSHIGERESIPGADGKRKIKVLNQTELCTKITKTFAKHFDFSKNGKQRNAHALATREKYIDITDAVISNGTGLQICNSNDNIVLPFIGTHVSFEQIQSSAHFESLPAENRLEIILSCIGYNDSTAKMSAARLQTIITELHRVFGVPERAYQLNYMKKKGANTGSIFGAQPVHQHQQYMVPAPQVFHHHQSDASTI